MSTPEGGERLKVATRDKKAEPYQPASILATADTHVGSNSGLNHPKFWKYAPDFKPMQRETWRAFERMIEPMRPITHLVIAGDCIDGDQYKNKGFGLWTRDRRIQAEAMVEIIAYTGASRVYIAAGTAYHVGKSEQWENIVASNVSAKCAFGAHHFIPINGKIFDVKHKVGRSNNPYYGHTQLGNVVACNRKAALKGREPKADVFIRAHAHYFRYIGEEDYLAMAIPSLQMETWYGETECGGDVAWGTVSFRIDAKGVMTWQPNIPRLSCGRASLTIL